MSSTAFLTEHYCDKLGPAKIVHLYDPGAALHGVLVIDNVACGPAIGGVRMAADITTEEVFRLARAMTLKNAAAGLPHGGGKAGIAANPKTADKPRLFARWAAPFAILSTTSRALTWERTKRAWGACR